MKYTLMPNNDENVREGHKDGKDKDDDDLSSHHISFHMGRRQGITLRLFEPPKPCGTYNRQCETSSATKDDVWKLKLSWPGEYCLTDFRKIPFKFPPAAFKQPCQGIKHAGIQNGLVDTEQEGEGGTTL